MAQTNHVVYSGLQASVAFQDAAELEALAQEVIPLWPVLPAHPQTMPSPFAHLSPSGAGKWRIDYPHDADRARVWNSVDALCDLISEMAWQRLRASPDLLCLHAAAVAFGDRLVVFPNARRAGKSTLSIMLAKHGLPLFTDDFLPVEITGEDGRLNGIANGVAPRLRLPLPAEFSEDMKSWVADNPGPQNKQYKYLTGLPLADGDSRLPIGAVVVLDRQDLSTAPRLEPVTQADILKVLITQNFSRDQHAGRILKSIEAATQTAPLYRLVYSDAEEAAAWLAGHSLLQDLPEARIAQPPRDDLEETYQRELQPAENFDPNAIYQQVSGLINSEVDGAQFLVDGQGNSIHQLNQGSMAIWRILSEPASLDDVVEILSIAFPEMDPQQIQIDATGCLRQFVEARLIEKLEGEAR